MAGILYTYGANVSGTASYFESFDTIAHSPGDLTSAVELTLSEPGSADLHTQLAGRAVTFHLYRDPSFSDPDTSPGGVVTGNGNDTIYGGRGADVLNGSDGNDTIYAAATPAGDDQASDTLIGGKGNDLLVDYFGASTDISGGEGDDTIRLATPIMFITPMTGTVDGGDGVDRLESVAAGTDNYKGPLRLQALTITGVEIVDASAGIYATATQFNNFQTIENATGTLTQVGAGSVDLTTQLLGQNAKYRGSSGADFIRLSNGNDKVEVREGADTIYGTAGADQLDGGSGTDTVDYSASSAPVAVNLGTGIGTGGDAQGDTYISIENVIGSASDDVLTGNIAVNRLEGGNGTDTVAYTSSKAWVRVDLSTGVGDNGDAEDDVYVSIENIVGSSYADTLIGTSGTNRIEGGAGNDVLAGLAGADILIGGDDFDTVSYNASSAAVRADLTTGTGTGGDAEGDTYTSIESIRGSKYADTLIGNAALNRLEGGDGDDLFSGRGGADQLWGGNGVDTVTYGLSTAAVSVDLTAGTGTGGYAEGNTFLSIENLIGSNYGDTLVGNASANRIEAGGGSDTLSGRGGADVLIGGSGVDTATFGTSSAAVRVDLMKGIGTGGDAQGDTYSSIENVVGSANADTLIGTTGVNRLEGGNGDDLLSGRGGADVLIGGSGIDTTTFNASAAAVRVDLMKGIGTGGDAEGDTYSSIENVIGSAYADTLIGTAGANWLEGGDGADTLSGRGGADVLIGGKGVDTVTFNASAGAVRVDFTAGTGLGGDAEGDSYAELENIIGSAYDDTLIGNAASNRIEGGDGNDILSGRAGADTLIGGTGTDTASYGTAAGAVSVDLQNNTASGSDAAGDSFSSIENLIGSANGDTLRGDTKANRLAGGLGSDTLTGRGGSDRFVFDTALSASNIDTITDFTVGTDAIELAKSIFTTLEPGIDPGSLSPSAFRYSNQASSSDGLGEIIYNAVTGSLSYDSDGAGAAAAKQFATVSTNLAMSASQFRLA
jgi:Ca2+-binding RTX toxin-like protein